MFDMFFTMQKWEKITNKSIHWEAFNIGSHPQIRHVRYTQLSFAMAGFVNLEEARNILEYISWQTNAVHPVW